MRKSWVLFTLIAFCLASCRKYDIKHNACDGELKVTPSNYNRTNVTIQAPNIITPNADGVNDIFMLFLSGVEGDGYKIKRDGITVFTSDSLNHWWQPPLGANGEYTCIAEVTTVNRESLTIKAKFRMVFVEYGVSIEVKDCEKCLFPDMITTQEGDYYETAEWLKCND
jgi:hypothetical protein